MRCFRNYHPFLWLTACGALFLLTVMEILKPGAFFWDDNLVQFFPWYEFDYYALLHGSIPQINFYSYLGHPYLSSDQPGVFYPPIYLGMALGHAAGRPELGLEWIIWVHLIAGALMVEKIIRQCIGPPALAMGGAWLYLTLPFNLCSAEIWVENSYTIFFVPLIFLLLERLLQTPSFYHQTLLTVAKAFFLLSGHVNYFALSLIFEASYIFVCLVGNKTAVVEFLGSGWNSLLPHLRVFLLWVLANLLAFLLALPATGPVLDHLREFAERSQPYPLSTILGWSLHPFIFFSAQIGFFRNDAWNNYSFRPGWMFLGGSIFLIILPLAGWRNRQVRYWGTMTLLAIIFSTSAYALIAFLPGYHSFRWPMKNLLFVGFFYALFFISFLSIARQRWKSSAVVAVLVLAIAANFSVAVSGAGTNGAERFPRFPVAFHIPRERLQEGRSFLASIGMSEFFNPDYLPLGFATLAHVPVLAGYDPLVLKQNKREALDTVFLGICDHPLDDTLMPHLNNWSVRYYFVHEPSPAGNFLHSLPEVHEIYQRGNLQILENTQAAPLAYFEDAPRQSLPLHFGVNEVTVDTRSHPGAGTVSLSLIPLPGYTWTLPEQAFRSVPVATSGRMRIPGVKGGGMLRIDYQEPLLPLFFIISLFTLLALVWGVYRESGRSGRLFPPFNIS